MDLERELSRYDYAVKPSQIATAPAHPRDSAKLAVFDRATGTTVYDTFLHLDRYLEPGTLLILNDTKVVPARLPCFLPTGGKVELLWLRVAKRSRHSFEALSPKILAIGTTLRFGALVLSVVSKRENIYTITHTGSTKQFHAAMMQSGTTPIPPYLKHTSLKERELRTEYQTIFAKHEGSVAAPTASLHFTPRLLKKLKARGFRIAYVTLHVGLGTFAPLTEEHLKSGTLHEEWYEIPTATARAIAKAKKEGRPVIPVGTTALRTLESGVQHCETGSVSPGTHFSCWKNARASRRRAAEPLRDTARLAGSTTLFVREGYQFKVADGLITNFHVPRSSLLMLVAALVGFRPGHRPVDGRMSTLALYRSAIRRGFRLFSFGDGMLIR